MTEAARLLVLKDVIGELERRGKTITRSESTLLTVDGVWVGVWVMPIMKRGAISKCVMRLGFGPHIIEEHELKLGPAGLADKIEAWLSINSEASLKRSATPKPVLAKGTSDVQE